MFYSRKIEKITKLSSDGLRFYANHVILEQKLSLFYNFCVSSSKSLYFVVSMGIKVLIDEGLAHRLPALSAGVLVGSRVPLCILSYHATPLAPDGVSRSRWMASHVDQVNGMCVGGVCVIGIYTPKNAAEAEVELGATRTAGLNLLICKGGKGRLMGKEVRDEGTKSVDLKNVSRLLSEIVQVMVRVGVDITVAEERKVEERLCEELKEGMLLLEGGHAVAGTNDERALSDVMEWTKEGAKTVSGEIFLPVGMKEGRNRVRVRGGMHVEAVVMPDSKVSEVLRVVRDDLERSVRTRMQLLREMEEGDEIEAQESVRSKAVPVRVVARAQGRLPMTDYLTEGESLDEDVQGRFVEVLSWTDEEIEQYNLILTERFAEVTILQSVPRTKKPDVEPLDIETVDADASMDGYIPIAIGLAVLIAFLAILYKNLFA